MVFRDYEKKVTQMYDALLESFQSLSNKQEPTLDEIQQFNSQAKEIIEGFTKLLDMFNDRLKAELSESDSSLEAKQNAFSNVLQGIKSIQEVYQEVIRAHQPVEDQSNRQDVERENKKLQERLGKEQKLVIDLRKQLQEQSRKLCVTCLSADANIAFIPCGHVCTCRQCLPHFNNKCPVCRRSFTSSIRVYNV